MIHPAVTQTAAGVQDHYDELDPVYREIWGEHVHHGYWRTGRETPGEATEALVELVATKLGVAPGDRLCDIGCGYGASAEYLAERHGAVVTGFTLSEAQAAIARARSPAAGAIDFYQRDWLDNGLADGTFDGAYAIESSEHMVDKDLFFAEAARVLRPGGRLVVCAWLSRTDPKSWEVSALLEPICREGRLPSMGSREDYESMAARVGLDAISFEDLSSQVRRTWSICARRVGRKLVADRDFRRFAMSRSTRNRSFLFSLPRLMLALKTGAMRYGVFVWVKPPA